MNTKQQSEDEELVEKKIEDLIQSQKNKSKISSLTPYIAEIERRKKLRELAKQSKKKIHQSSSKSFRIKQNSLTLLQKDPRSKTKNNSNGVISKLLEQKANRDQRAKSLQRHRDFLYSKTLQNCPKQSSEPQSNNFFNDLYVKIQRKVEKDKLTGEKKYQTIDASRAHSSQPRNSSHTNHLKGGQTLAYNKSEEQRKEKGKNFRRNKFQVQSQPTLKIQRIQEVEEEKDHITKKQSNASINKQMDKLAERQMECFYKHTRNKEIHRSVEHSTEQYFNTEPYRPTKSKNQIEVFLSIAKIPAVQRVSSFTEDHSKTNQRKINSYLYDFNFPEEEQPQQGFF